MQATAAKALGEASRRRAAKRRASDGTAGSMAVWMVWYQTKAASLNTTGSMS